MNRALAVAVVMALAGCDGAAESPPDADPFGVPCTNHGWSPLEACHAADGDVGWCIAPFNGSGDCRRGCDGGHACLAGETPTIIFNDCYCQP